MSDKELSKLPASVFETKYFKDDMIKNESAKVNHNIFGARLSDISTTLFPITPIYTGAIASTNEYEIKSALNRVPLSYNDNTLVSSDIGLTILGVKDNLEPIDTYIEKIKASEEYKKFELKQADENKQSTELEPEPTPTDLPTAPENIIADTKNSLITIFKIDNGTARGYDRKLFVTSIANKIKTRLKNGKYDEVIDTVNYIEEMNSWSKENGGKDLIGNRNAVWKMRDEAMKEKNAEVSGTTDNKEAENSTTEEELSKIENIKDPLEMMNAISDLADKIGDDEVEKHADKFNELVTTATNGINDLNKK